MSRALPLRHPGGVLTRIVARKGVDLAARWQARGRPSKVPDDAPPPRDFAGALAGSGVALIAEIKPRSPSRGDLLGDRDPLALAHAYGPRAAAVSVLCDGPFFGGSLALLSRVRQAVRQPVLCKDFIIDPAQLIEARGAGADAVLLMAALLPPTSMKRLLARAADLGLAALVEVHDAVELAEVLQTDATLIGVNSRDLRTMSIDLARMGELAAQVPGDRMVIGESGIESAEDVAALADRVGAVLIGSAVAGDPDPGRKLDALGWPASCGGRWRGTPCR